MNERTRLPNRRACETFNFECAGFHYTANIGRFDDGRLAEIFISNGKAGSALDTAAKDAAVICSISLQHGVPVDVIRHALLRDPRGIAASPLGVVLDKLSHESPTAEPAP